MNLVTSSGDSGHIESDEEQEPGEDTLTTGGCLCPSLVHARDACIGKKQSINVCLRILKTKKKEFSFKLSFSSTTAYARSLMLVLISMLMSHTSLHFFVLSFVLACVYAYVASGGQD